MCPRGQESLPPLVKKPQGKCPFTNYHRQIKESIHLFAYNFRKSVKVPTCRDCFLFGGCKCE
jgi:hypothetical protein